MQKNQLLPLLLPCVFFWRNKRTIAGLVCLGLQITLIGWIIAALWAIQTLRKSNKQPIKNAEELA